MNRATALDPDDLEGLIPRVVSQAELDEHELKNILEAWKWIRSTRKLCADYPSPESLRRLHGRMFDRTWRWAGRYRVRATNLGFDPVDIPEAVAQLCAYVRTWSVHETYPLLERAARFHHRLVQIHPFVNGNGRHARLAADILMICGGRRPLRWGSRDPHAAGEDRRRYIESLQAADEHDLGPLLAYLEQSQPDDNEE
ncbi:mobile mystery protein B [bacterium]|nr:mobile mystery protein B [bacterium]